MCAFVSKLLCKMKVKSTLHSPFLEITMAILFFVGESNIVELCWNLFEKLGKNEVKNWNLHFNLSNPKKNTKRINVQSKVDFTKDGTSDAKLPQKNYHYGIFSYSGIGN
jgi:hypothetical protein